MDNDKKKCSQRTRRRERAQEMKQRQMQMLQNGEHKSQDNGGSGDDGRVGGV